MLQAMEDKSAARKSILNMAEEEARKARAVEEVDILRVKLIVKLIDLANEFHG